jgi:hypothetical protein
MNKIYPFIGILVLVIGTIGAGLLQGSLANRWGPSGTANRAAEVLRSGLPQEVGNWRVRNETPFSSEVVRILQCPAHISRVYEHQQTGDTVRVAVIVGPPGPVSVHTPEICYASRDVSIDGERRKLLVKDAGGGEHSLWEVPFKSNDLDGSALRAAYGWTNGSTFEAASHPRIGYGGFTHLYKIQIAVPIQPRSQSTSFDPVNDFLENFLAQLKPLLVEATR